MKAYSAVLVVALLIFVFVLGLFQKENLDTYLHYSMGRVISEKGILNYDPFGHHGGATEAREYLPTEWLFQVIIYKFLSVFGFSAYKIFGAFFGALQVGVVFLIFSKVFKLRLTYALIASLSFALLGLLFFVARPYIIAYLLLLTTLFLILRFVLQDKNQLIFILPIAYVWVNLHPSIFLGLALAISYCLVCGFLFLKKGQKVYLKKSKILLLLSLGIFGISILPPVGFGAYQFTFLMLNNSGMLKDLVAEWTPLSSNKLMFGFYSLICVLTLISYLVTVIRKKNFVETSWVLPILFLMLPGFFNIRNIYFGYMAFCFSLGLFLSSIDTSKLKGRKLLFLKLGLGVLLIAEGTWAFRSQKNFVVNIPVKAVDFLNKNEVKGNMFNQFAFGGYLEYRLYPKYKIFADGRMDSYLCCELKDFHDLKLYKWQGSFPTEPLAKLFEKYKISYAVLVKENDSQGQVFSEVLLNNPDWRLVYRDDNSDIWLKNDGLNPELFKKSVQYLNFNSPTPKSGRFSNSEMGIAFNVPDTLKAEQKNYHLVTMTKKDVGAENQILIYVTESLKLEDDPNLPFKLNGELQQAISIPNKNFETKVVLYGDGAQAKQFFVLKDDNRLIVVYPTSDIDPQMILDIVQSVTKAD